jgi:3-deoxy-manno-octulosonate cytidylyltransferase (CMP-KDO synthetase)
MSRSIIPFNHTQSKIKYYKQICIYSYPRKILKYFNNKKGLIEANEDIEILRLIENGIKVKMIKVSTKSFAIDTKKDFTKFKNLYK